MCRKISSPRFEETWILSVIANAYILAVMGSEDNQKQCKETIKDGDGIRMREKQGQKNFPYISTPTHLKADQETKQKEMKMHELFSNDSFLHGPYMQLSSCELTRSCF